MTKMNNKLTDKRIGQLVSIFAPQDSDPVRRDIRCALCELRELRKTAEPELNPANLVNKFYERYPLASFRDDGFRAAALGYFMAGAELQCFGEFVNYEDLCCAENGTPQACRDVLQ